METLKKTTSLLLLLPLFVLNLSSGAAQMCSANIEMNQMLCCEAPSLDCHLDAMSSKYGCACKMSAGPTPENAAVFFKPDLKSQNQDEGGRILAVSRLMQSTTKEDGQHLFSDSDLQKPISHRKIFDLVASYLI